MVEPVQLKCNKVKRFWSYRFPLAGASLAVLLHLMSACSIKEDRSGCPARYTLLFSGPDKTIGTDYSFGLSGDGPRDGFVYQGGAQRRVYDLRRGHLKLYAFCGWEGGGVYRVPEGACCDSVYTTRRSIVCDGERVLDSLILHKDFATLFISMECTQGNPLRIKVLADVCGIDAGSGDLQDGLFECSPPLAEGSSLITGTVRIPRQRDGFRVQFLDAAGLICGELQFDEALAAALSYSWDKEDLDDISLNGFYSSGTLSFGVVPWNDGGVSGIEL